MLVLTRKLGACLLSYLSIASWGPRSGATCQGPAPADPGTSKEAILKELSRHEARNQQAISMGLSSDESCPKGGRPGVSGDPVTLSATCTTAGRWRRRAVTRYRFSAFWLRSSVVSVLISLISDTFSIRGQYIKWVFGAGSWNRSLLRPLHASTWYCSTSRNGAPPQGISLEYLKAEIGFVQDWATWRSLFFVLFWQCFQFWQLQNNWNVSPFLSLIKCV